MKPPIDPSQTLLILLITTVGLLILLVAICLRIMKRLKRMEKLLAEAAERRREIDSEELPQENSAGGAFEAFLNEDPERLNLSKSEQFAAYRRWRQENGMNWSNG